MSITYVLRDEYPRHALEMMVSGRDRHIYFKRPIIPLLQPQIPEVVMQVHETQRPHESVQSEVKLETSKTVEVQTMFRESEVQTIPYSPEYIVKEGEDPEVLNFTYFVYGNGLPASMTEMELIEQSREKRIFESMLPSSTDEACFLLRRKLMDEQEFKEWAKRENDIKRIQNERNLLPQHTILHAQKNEIKETFVHFGCFHFYIPFFLRKTERTPDGMFLSLFIPSFNLSLHSPAEGQDRTTERVELN